MVKYWKYLKINNTLTKPPCKAKEPKLRGLQVTSPGHNVNSTWNPRGFLDFITSFETKTEHQFSFALTANKFEPH